MTEAMIKKAVSEAEDSLKDKQIQEVKQIVLRTLEKIQNLDKDIDRAKVNVKDLEEQKKILRMDLDDMKEGRLDRIAERQEKDEKAKDVSVVIIIKEKEVIHDRSPWYWPYQVVWQTPYVPTISPNVIQYADGNSGVYSSFAGTTNGLAYKGESYTSPAINCSVTKFSTIGTYDVAGNIINLR